MSQTNSRIFDEFARLMTGAAGAAQGIKREIEEIVKKLAVEQKEKALAEDRRNYLEGVSKARGMILEHKFESAAAEYRSLPLLLSTKEYRDRAKLKFAEIDFIKTARQTLIDQINRKKLASQIRVKINNRSATAIRADSEKLVAKYDDFDATAPCSWTRFGATEMISFLKACNLDAKGHLAAGIYAKELRNPAAAQQHFDAALSKDSALKAEVEKYSRDLR